MKELLAFKFGSEHLLLCVLASLLWGVIGSSVSPSPDTTLTTSTATTLAPTKPPLENVKDVKVVKRNESSITLMWDKVNNISTYILKYNDSSSAAETGINASQHGTSVEHVVSPLVAGTKYDFTLITVFEGRNSTGSRFHAVTAPRDAEQFRSVGQTETSITLQWKRVNNILNYRLKFNGEERNITATAGQETVEETISDLTNTTAYHFTLFTVFENVRSSGVNLTAVTAPRDAEEFGSVGQTETSITLQWKRVNDILNYILKFNGEERNVTATAGQETVEKIISDLTNTTAYHFTLFTVFENVRSSGVNLTAVTAPEDVKDVKVVKQNENSITLMWDKVNNISTYILKYNDSSSTAETDINASQHGTSVEHVVSPLVAGTKYDFTLITVFEGRNSTGSRFHAVTAPRNAEEFRSVGQTETSITLQWKRVNDILNYRLKFNGEERNVTATAGQETVEETISDLTNTTAYHFTLFTVFENVRSSGVNHTAVTTPRDAEQFRPVGQTETSITLQWKRVNDILNYRLKFNGEERNVTATMGQETVTYRISDLTNTTEYHFTLFTVFENVRSSGVNLTAVTAPRDAEEFGSVGQTETSITLQWKRVNNILNYRLKFNGEERNITATAGQETVEETISDLTNTTAYHFTLFTVFENVRSSGVNLTAVTTPRNAEEFGSVGQTETSITLQWKRVNDILNYRLKFNGEERNVTATAGQETVEKIISDLTNTTEYHFTLFTVFENVRSSGVNLTAVTAPPNADEFRSVGQTETSVTLQWKRVENILNYILTFNGEERNVTATMGHQNAHVTHMVSGLRSGTKYNFSLFSVFRNVRSGAVNQTAVTAPENVKGVTVLTQSEGSITLMWHRVSNISTYVLRYDGGDSAVHGGPQGEASVTHEVSPLAAGRRYGFNLSTVFEGVHSTGYAFHAATVPPAVPAVSVTRRCASSVTLEWEHVAEGWSYLLQINGGNVTVETVSRGVVSHPVASLRPGTKYAFSVTTVFYGLDSAAYEDFTVTAIDCSAVPWRVTNSSIQGVVEGLFSHASLSDNASAPNPGGGNVTFAGLCPGETYEVTLVYETQARRFEQCRHNLTIRPPRLSARCEYLDGGYSIFIGWDKPRGVWTEVEVNVTGRSHREPENGNRHLEMSGFLPAKTYKVAVTSLSGPVRSHEPFVFLCSTDPRGVIAGSVLALLLFGVLVCLVIVILLKRPDFLRKKAFIGGSRLSNKAGKAISVADFPDHFSQLSTDENRGFSEEYESLDPVGTEQTRRVAVLPENKAKNRFSNVLPYDWCRVTLTTSNVSGTSDYINASYMPGYHGNREYIATQGPLPTTVSDFWRMIWEQSVRGIVMVTNCTEGGRAKCEQYWPADSKPRHCGQLSVTMTSEQREADWTLRHFSVTNTDNSETRAVKHFHFTAWPDHGVPPNTEGLIHFRGLVRRHIELEGTGAPTVVHCSAGVGRTGTIIALDVLLQQLDKKRAVGANAFVHKMRLSRPYMVQTESQYIFLHQCIMDCLQSDEGADDPIYENADMIYVNATALREFR